MIKPANQSQQHFFSRQAEYDVVRKDLRRVLILNLIYLVGILALYYTNNNSHYLEKWFAKILHF